MARISKDTLKKLEQAMHEISHRFDFDYDMAMEHKLEGKSEIAERFRNRALKEEARLDGMESVLLALGYSTRYVDNGEVDYKIIIQKFEEVAR